MHPKNQYLWNRTIDSGFSNDSQNLSFVRDKMTRKGRKLANSQMIPVFLMHKTIQANILIKIEFAFKETTLDANVYINERHFLFRISR